MKISILTLFPEMFSGPFAHSIVKRAIENKKLEINFVNIRDFGIGKHKMVDDTPYGGGVGMVMRVDVLTNALNHAKCKTTCKEYVVLSDASGNTFRQATAKKFSALDHLILICGHYEGVDARIRHFVDEVISIGDFVLTGGEIPAIAIVDATIRLLPGVLGKDSSSQEESFQTIEGKQLLEYPQYTKPAVFENYKIPDVLLSGNHKNIAQWRKKEAEEITKKIRPDL